MFWCPLCFPTAKWEDTGDPADWGRKKWARERTRWSYVGSSSSSRWRRKWRNKLRSRHCHWCCDSKNYGTDTSRDDKENAPVPVWVQGCHLHWKIHLVAPAGAWRNFPAKSLCQYRIVVSRLSSLTYLLSAYQGLCLPFVLYPGGKITDHYLT